MMVFLGSCAALPVRRSVVRQGCVAAAGAALSFSPACSAVAAQEDVLWGPLKGLNEEQVGALARTSSAPDAGYLLPSGVRVIDLVPGAGRLPLVGERVYCSYKVWAKGFDSGPVADWTFMDGRPYDWVLGTPTDRIPPAVDEGCVGMREGGWRRLVVPEAYGDAGLRKINPLKGGGRYTPPKAGYVIKPQAIAYFDLIMLDGGSGRCDKLLRPAGASEPEARKLRSRLCQDVRTETGFL